MIPPSMAPPDSPPPHVPPNDSKCQGTRPPLAHPIAALASDFARRTTAHSSSANLARRAPAGRCELIVALAGERTCGASTLWPTRRKVITRRDSSTRRPAPLTAPTHRWPQLDWGVLHRVVSPGPSPQSIARRTVRISPKTRLAERHRRFPELQPASLSDVAPASSPVVVDLER